MVNLVKANGEKEEFSEEKLRTSIKRAGIPQDLQEDVVNHVISRLHENMTTSQMYQHVVEFLGTSHPHHAARYSLKKSLMDLGPTGYPFEDYVARILAAIGYATQVRTIVMGKCIRHEIDIVAQKVEEKIMVEAKFHNVNGIKTDIHVALYTYARFEDVKQKGGFTKPALITNTKLSSDVISYGECMGMKLIGWSYPEGNSLRDLIEQFSLYPITALTSLTTSNHQELLSNQVVICSDIVNNPSCLDMLSLPEEKKKEVSDEAKFLSRK